MRPGSRGLLGSTASAIPATWTSARSTAFLTHLVTSGRVSASTQNQALAALLFLYDKALHRPLGQVEGVARARRPRRMPVVLTPKEVRAVLDSLGDTPSLVCGLLYGSGLRLLECLRLRVTVQAPPARVGHPAGREGRGAPGGGDQARIMSHVPAFVRHAPPGRWIRHPDGPGAARAQGREDDDGLHPRVESRREGSQEPYRQPAALRQAGRPPGTLD